VLAAGAVDIAQKFSRFTEHWSPKIIAESNGWQFKLVKARGEFVWHQHEIDEVWRMSHHGRRRIHRL
jgi:hypothetical protein